MDACVNAGRKMQLLCEMRQRVLFLLRFSLISSVAGVFGVVVACVSECDITNDFGESAAQYARTAQYVGGRSDYALIRVERLVVLMASWTMQTTSANRRRSISSAVQSVVAGGAGYILFCVKRLVASMAVAVVRGGSCSITDRNGEERAVSLARSIRIVSVRSAFPQKRAGLAGERMALVRRD